MKATYDEDVDAMNFRLSKSRVADSEMIQPGVIIDYDKQDRIVGIEILNFKKRFDRKISVSDIVSRAKDKGRSRAKSRESNRKSRVSAGK